MSELHYKQLFCPECSSEFWIQLEHTLDEESLTTFCCSTCDCEIIKESHHHLKLFIKEYIQK